MRIRPPLCLVRIHTGSVLGRLLLSLGRDRNLGIIPQEGLRGIMEPSPKLVCILNSDVAFLVDCFWASLAADRQMQL